MSKGGKHHHRTSFFCKIILYLMILVAQGLFSDFALAQTAKPRHPQYSKVNKMNTTLPAPKSPQEMWDRIVMLIKTNHGFVSKDDIERIVGIGFDHVEKDGEKRDLGADYLYTTERELPGIGLVKMGMSEGGRSLPDIPKFNGYEIEWGSKEFQVCLSLDALKKDLVGLGFEGGASSQQPGSSTIQFARPEDIRRISEKYKSDPKYGYKFSIALPSVHLVLPSKQSDCVIGFNATFFD